MSIGDENNSDESSTLQVDAYGIKTSIKARPSPSSEEPPQTWLEVWGRINRSIMRITCEPFMLVADTLSATRSFVRGFGNLPDYWQRKVQLSHYIAEEREAEAQQIALSSKSNSNVDEEANRVAVAHVRELIENLRSRGVPCQIIKKPDGTLVLAIVHADQVDTVLSSEVISSETSSSSRAGVTGTAIAGAHRAEDSIDNSSTNREDPDLDLEID
ncbi:hypothetical protein [Bremerella alba]|uniref:Uncharacterized protein n=1 Tax=Bremerella alba TaxID=980252 RepID=A0A7V8V4A2_9BACT|nr:hypothetical protein [Bremerella alba]MBA2114659.1 hypothetical protein [Bremerella alba]